MCSNARLYCKTNVQTPAESHLLQISKYLFGREFVVKVKADRIMDLFALFLLNIFFEQPISDFLIKCKRGSIITQILLPLGIF